MLEYIKIENFKRIQKPGIELLELSHINYLVGENGCGKSSVLESLINYYFCHIDQNYNLNNIDYNQKCLLPNIKLKHSFAEFSPIIIKSNGIEYQTEFQYNLNKQNQTISNPTWFYKEKRLNLDLEKQYDSHFVGPSGIKPQVKALDPKTNVFDPASQATRVLIRNKESVIKQIHSSRQIDSIDLARIQDIDKDFNNTYSQKTLKYLRHLLKNRLSSIDLDQDKEENLEIQGEEILSKLALGIIYLHFNFQINCFLIEEPENHLFPGWQKKLPYLFDFLNREYHLQFIISTHSPFIISSSSALVESQKDKFENNLEKNKKEFIPSQKVYFLKNGLIASKRGEIEFDSKQTQKGRFGYSGNRCVYISSKMLGAGLMDFIPTLENVKPKNSPIIIFCEGQGEDEDAKFYNLIFKNLNINHLFISAKGSSQLFHTYNLIQELKPGLSANFEVKMLRDRDHQFPTLQHILDFEKSNKEIKILRKRAIECYLYNNETAELFAGNRHKNLNRNLQKAMDDLQESISFEAEHKILGDDYKIRLRDLFMAIVQDVYDYKISEIPNLKELISAKIHPKTKTYQELYDIIFD